MPLGSIAGTATAGLHDPDAGSIRAASACAGDADAQPARGRGRTIAAERIGARDPDATRRRLLEAAGTLVDRDGDLGLRVTDVAEAAGTSVGTIYVHFQDRDALVAAVHAQRFRGRTDEMIEEMREVLDADLDRDGYARALLELVIRPDDERYAEIRRGRVAALAAAQRDPDLAKVIADALREIDDLLVEVFERAKDLGLLRRELDTRAISLLVQAVAFGLAISDARDTDPPDRDAWLALLVTIVDALRPAD